MKLHISGDRKNPIFRFFRNLWVKHHATRRYLSVEGWDGYRLRIYIESE
jgi:hypothetical protein